MLDRVEQDVFLASGESAQVSHFNKMGLPPPLILLPHSFPTPDSGLIPHSDEKHYAMHIVVSYPPTTPPVANALPSIFCAIPSLGGEALAKTPPSRKSLGTPPPRPSSTAPNATITPSATSRSSKPTTSSPPLSWAGVALGRRPLHIPPKGQQTERYNPDSHGAHHPPFPSPPGRPNGCFRSLPQKQFPSSPPPGRARGKSSMKLP
jgi:hypothetical protein